MPLETFITYLGLIMAAAWTPGPNNAMLTASGVNFGFVRTVPHALGVTLGFPVMIFFVSLGLGELFERSPLIRDIMRWGGAALLLYIAWRTATASGKMKGSQSRKPFTFLQAAAFQWVNPKAWAMSIAITSQFITGSGNTWLSAVIVAAGAAFAGATSTFTWSLGGASLQRWLNSDGRLKIFNVIMGLMIAGCVVLLF